MAENSVCVIGAGIGGLTTGAYLARHGYQVTIIEKSLAVGGSAGGYVRKGRLFPAGATLAFGLEEEGVLRSLLHELSINLPAQELYHPMDVVLPDRSISIYRDPIRWEEELKKKFPGRSGEILCFWRQLSEIGDLVLAVTAAKASLPIRRLYDLGGLPGYAVKHPLAMLRLARYMRWTVEDLMRKHGLEHDTPFRQLLNAQLLDAAQTDVSTAALLPSSVALTIYRKGSFSLENGLSTLCRRLADRIIELGGRIVLGSPVHSLSYSQKDKAWQVDSLKVSNLFRIVVNSSGVSFDPKTAVHESRREKAWGAFRLDAIVKDEVRQGALRERMLPFAYQIVPDPDHAKLFGDEHGPVYVTFHQSLDSKGRPVAGEILMTASVHTHPEPWLSCGRDAYERSKEQTVNAILAEIEKVVPVREHLLFEHAGTPATYKRFIGKAEVGGYPLSVEHAVLKPRGVRSSARQLFFAGEQVFPGPGTLSSALSGYYAARAIMKDFPL